MLIAFHPGFPLSPRCRSCRRPFPAPPQPKGVPIQTRTAFLPVAGGALLLLSLACHGGSSPSALAQAVVASPTLEPAQARLIPGASLQFTTNAGQFGGSFSWTVTPPSSGSISPSGLFTAAGPPGTCTVAVVLTAAPALAATATLDILPPPQAVASSPNAAFARGAQQATGDGTIRNFVVLNEPTRPTDSTDANGFLHNRSNFYPAGRSPQ